VPEEREYGGHPAMYRLLVEAQLVEDGADAPLDRRRRQCSACSIPALVLPWAISRRTSQALTTMRTTALTILDAAPAS